MRVRRQEIMSDEEFDLVLEAAGKADVGYQMQQSGPQPIPRHEPQRAPFNDLEVKATIPGRQPPKPEEY